MIPEEHQLSQSRWILPSLPDPAIPSLHPDPLLHQLLAGRGIRDSEQAAEFLDPRSRPAPDPFGLPNMQAAVDRIARAIGDRETIGIFGDYDADGVTSTAILALTLRSLADEAHLILASLPTRTLGYGLNAAAIDAFADAGASLLIAVDCGSGDHEHVAYARDRGLDVIALDHHQIQGGPADGAIVVSAQLGPSDQYQQLCAAGVAYMTAVALEQAGFSVGEGAFAR